MTRDTVRGIVLISGKVNDMNKSTERGIRRTWGKDTSLTLIKSKD